MKEKPIKNLILTAMGDMEPDLVIKGALIFNSFTGFFTPADLAVKDGYIAGVGAYDSTVTIDGRNHYLLPGLMDSHVHIESSLCSPAEFARALNANGVTTVIADPHEIANVAGAKGIQYFLDASEGTPVNIFVMLPSCVPASDLECGGATLKAQDLLPFICHPRVLGLGEMMNFPGVLSLDPEVLEKMNLKWKDCPTRKEFYLDGHAPGLMGRSLTAYAAAGISSDHESTSCGELSDKLSSGIFCLLREGTAAKNLLNLLPIVTSFNSRFCAMATDDRHAIDLKVDGSINHLLRVALAARNVSLPELINMASLNGALHYGLTDIGALAPGYRADMALYPDLWSFRPSMVWKDGVLTAREGKSLVPVIGPGKADAMRHSVKLGPIKAGDLKALASKSLKARVIGMRDSEIVTDELIMELPVRSGEFLSDPEKDIAKMAVFDRYRPESKPAIGFLKGLGLKRGAIGSTVSHDSHNLVVLGASDKDMIIAAKRLAAIEGGLIAVLDGKVLGELPLPIGGLMSTMTLLETANILGALLETLPRLGFGKTDDPFMPLAFMSLPVVPELKLTSKGLVDVKTSSIVPLNA
ncbi:MAG: adenine deaminase [Deltaproteobacteria bacterium]|nr:adenine deaminase [Deltaproteobacteria bacterium]